MGSGLSRQLSGPCPERTMSVWRCSRACAAVLLACGVSALRMEVIAEGPLAGAHPENAAFIEQGPNKNKKKNKNNGNKSGKNTEDIDTSSLSMKSDVDLSSSMMSNASSSTTVSTKQEAKSEIDIDTSFSMTSKKALNKTANTTFDEEAKSDVDTSFSSSMMSNATSGMTLNMTLDEVQPYVLLHTLPLMTTSMDATEELEKLYVELRRVMSQVHPKAADIADFAGLDIVNDKVAANFVKKWGHAYGSAANMEFQNEVDHIVSNSGVPVSRAEVAARFFGKLYKEKDPVKSKGAAAAETATDLQEELGNLKVLSTECWTEEQEKLTDAILKECLERSKVLRDWGRKDVANAVLERCSAFQKRAEIIKEEGEGVQKAAGKSGKQKCQEFRNSMNGQRTMYAQIQAAAAVRLLDATWLFANYYLFLDLVRQYCGLEFKDDESPYDGDLEVLKKEIRDINMDLGVWQMVVLNKIGWRLTCTDGLAKDPYYGLFARVESLRGQFDQCRAKPVDACRECAGAAGSTVFGGLQGKQQHFCLNDEGSPGRLPETPILYISDNLAKGKDRWVGEKAVQGGPVTPSDWLAKESQDFRAAVQPLREEGQLKPDEEVTELEHAMFQRSCEKAKKSCSNIKLEEYRKMRQRMREDGVCLQELGQQVAFHTDGGLEGFELVFHGGREERKQQCNQVGNPNVGFRCFANKWEKVYDKEFRGEEGLIKKFADHGDPFGLGMQGKQ